jgi:hypothetical protein
MERLYELGLAIESEAKIKIGTYKNVSIKNQITKIRA